MPGPRRRPRMSGAGIQQQPQPLALGAVVTGAESASGQICSKPQQVVQKKPAQEETEETEETSSQESAEED
ncbi:hypothetical protein KIL84_020200 [Mauremys mutica]|uniref:Uncharacterized protein n=1 Tax=Mauremys mutica TaxID=74926 RepID=A0A9D3XW97_9SAUR|nr:hypothetical protein KIL84_020200 [Mauremys mutica]